jgi:hypothetical protein
MILSPDFKDFFASLNGARVSYLVVGGYAVALHGHPRYTKDIDVWIGSDEENAKRLVQAIENFGFGSLDLTAEDFLEQFSKRMVPLVETRRVLSLLY